MEKEIRMLSLLDANNETEISPMDSEMAEMFMGALFQEMKEPNVIFNEKIFKDTFNRDVSEVMSLKILIDRINWGTNNEAQITLPCVIFIASTCKSPGDCVLWAYTLADIFYKTKRPVSMDSLTMCFPMGLPNEEGKSRIWDAQKHLNGCQDNGIDLKENWVF